MFNRRARREIIALRLEMIRLQMMEESGSRPRRFGVREIFRVRQEQGDGQNLIEEMRLGDTQKFFEYTRMNIEMFEKLLSLVGPHLEKRNICTRLTKAQRLSMTLRYLAAGDIQTTLSFAYWCGQSTVSSILAETLPILADTLQPLYMKAPETQEEWEVISKGFGKRWNLPHCVGALDGKHVVMQAPKGSGSLFFNYKKSFSIVLLAACDADYCFTLVDIGGEGCHSDGGILKNSVFGKKLRGGNLGLPSAKMLPNSNIPCNFFFAGDNAFPLLSNLMKPFALKNLSLEEAIFNYRLCRGRRTIENAFGILAARWRIFRRPLCASLTTCTNTVRAAVCLHNYIKKESVASSERYCPAQFADNEDAEGITTPGEWRGVLMQEQVLLPAGRMGSRNSTREVLAQRENLKKYFLGPGKVEWQDQKVRRGFWGAAVQNHPNLGTATGTN